MTKAYAYLRVSTTGQVSGDGFPRQREAITKYAEANDIEVVQWFEEQVTGTNDLSRRPALTKLMMALDENGVKTVVIERLDRLARDLMVQETIVAQFRKNKFNLISTTEPNLLEDDPTRDLIRQIIGAVAQWDRRMLVLKLRAGINRMRAAGRYAGRKPFPDPERPHEQEIFNRMNELRGAGMNWGMIAQAMNEENIPTRISGKWHAATVRKILVR